MKKLEWQNGRLTTQLGVPTSHLPELDLLREACEKGLICQITFDLHRGHSAVTNLMNLAKLSLMHQLKMEDEQAFERVFSSITPGKILFRFSVINLALIHWFEWHCLKYDLVALEIVEPVASPV